MRPLRDELRESWHELPEPQVENPLPLIGILTIVLIAMLVIVAIWAAWSALDDRVEAVAKPASHCAGMTNVWDCAAQTRK